MPRKKKSATRRGNNEGSIYQRKDGLWIAQVTIGVKEDGKIARKSFTGKSRAEVAEKIIPYLNKNKGQVVVAKEDVTIGKHLMFWLMNYKITTVSPRTFESCVRNMKNHIIPVFGYLKPQDLTIDHLQPRFKTLLKNYELDTVKKIKYVFSQYLDYCVDRGIIDSNPLDKIKFKTRERKTQQAKVEQEEKALPEELREPFLQALNTDRFMKAFCLTSMFAGLRPGEVFALKWKDIDFQQNTLSVVRAQTVDVEFDKEGNVLSRKTVIGETKTAGSVRTNPIPELLKEVLLEWREYRTVQQAETGYSLVESNDLVFGTNQGALRTYSGTKKMFERFLKRNGLAGKGIHFYELRHTFSNTLFEQNTNPRLIQMLMGHRKIETTMIYNTVRNNSYLKNAVGVFDERYSTAAEKVEESEARLKYYRPPKVKPEKEISTSDDVKQAEKEEKCEAPQEDDIFLRKMAEFMEQHNISTAEELFEALGKDNQNGGNGKGGYSM